MPISAKQKQAMTQLLILFMEVTPCLPVKAADCRGIEYLRDELIVRN